jgi:hypothetical protein
MLCLNYETFCSTHGMPAWKCCGMEGPITSDSSSAKASLTKRGLSSCSSGGNKAIGAAGVRSKGATSTTPLMIALISAHDAGHGQLRREPQTCYAKRQGWLAIAPALTTPARAAAGTAKAVHTAGTHSSAAVVRCSTAHPNANNWRATFGGKARNTPRVSYAAKLSFPNGPRNGIAPELAGNGLVASEPPYFEHRRGG